MTISAYGWADGELQIRVIDGRVDCPRVGTVVLDRCRECAYLLRMEDEILAGASETHVVCSAATADFGLESAW
jgi:hypothetical protein